MRKRITALTLVLVLAAMVATVDARIYRKINLGNTSYGMTTDEVQRAIGKPDHINTYGGARGEIQQWVYYEGPSQPLFLYLVNGYFDSYSRYGSK